jgi:hypothetical protein
MLSPRLQPQPAPSPVHGAAAWQVAAMMQARTAARDWVRYGLDGDACAQFLVEIEADRHALDTTGRQWLMRLAGCLLQWADESEREAKRHDAALLGAAKTLDPRQIGPQMLHGLGHDGLLMLMDAQKERANLLHARLACLQQAALARSAISMAARGVDAGASAAVLLMVFEHAMSVHEAAAQALEDMIDCAGRFEHDLSYAEEALARRPAAASHSSHIAASSLATDSDADYRTGASSMAFAGAVAGLALHAHAQSDAAPHDPAPTITVNPANGLPMIDEAIDIHGNAFGTTSIDDAFVSADHASDYTSDYASFPTQDYAASGSADTGFAPGGNDF